MKFLIDKGEGKAIDLHYFLRDRRALRRRRHWRIVGDINNKIKASGEKNGDPLEIDAWSRAVRWIVDGVIPSSKRYNSEWTALLASSEKSFHLLQNQFLARNTCHRHLAVAFYHCKIKRCKPEYSRIIKSAARKFYTSQNRLPC